MADFIPYIPQILLYIVPGFIVQKILETFTSRKQPAELNTILWSIVYSFVVAIMVDLLKWLYNLSSIRIPWFSNEDFKYAAQVSTYIICSIILGYCITQLTNSAKGERIVQLFNPSMKPGEDVWIKTLSEAGEAWVRVITKDGMVYFGALHYHTCNPDDPKRFVVLNHFRFGPLHDMTNPQTGRVYSALEDHTSNYSTQSDQVYQVIINFDDIAAIQIIPSVAQNTP